ncbi:hypothetical protein K501DRAFT_254382 [Backusella circina FSU 941]|nr:hypothetical protein K501DRAFT_254382 [Backusella circina FSU 941]
MQNKKEKLNDEHKVFLTGFFDDNPQAFIVDAVEKLADKFEGLKINKSRVNEFMKNEYNLSFKQVSFRPEARAVSHTILGCISTQGVINVSMRIPRAPPKVRKIQGGKKRKATASSSSTKESTGTTSGHYLRFIKETLDIMDKHKSMRGSYFIMDNASMHTKPEIEEEIKSRDRR